MSRAILKEALGYHEYPSLRTVDNHILKLRQKLERDPENPTHFLTVHRVGTDLCVKGTIEMQTTIISTTPTISMNG